MSLILKNVLITDDIDAQCVKILRENGIAVTINTGLAKDKTALLSEIGNYDGLIVRSGTKVTADVIAASRGLKIIGRAGTGVDNIDCGAATQKGIIVMNTPGGNTMSAAEHTCFMISAMTRHIPQAAASMREGRWDRKKYMGSELLGKTLAIIGLGRIGKEVATRMQSFGMRTIGYDPLIPGSVSAEFGVEWMEINQLWPLADYVTVHVPLIPQTKNLINDAVFASCKKGVKVVNVARGGIIEEDAILRALALGQCGGAALDVFVEEPPTNTALIQHPLVVSTPHLGASTVEAQSRVAVEIAQQFVDMVQGQALVGAINADALSHALGDDTKPWVSLVSAMALISQSIVGSVSNSTKVQITTFGNSLKNAGSYMKAAALVGLLPKTANSLNLVNAPVLAKEMGIQVACEHKESERIECVLMLQQANGFQSQLTGSASGGTAMLTAINGLPFTTGVSLEGDVLVYRSQANSSVMPAVAGTLAAANVLVKSFACTSPNAEGEMWSIMNTGQPITNLEILKLHVNFAQQLQF